MPLPAPAQPPGYEQQRPLAHNKLSPGRVMMLRHGGGLAPSRLSSVVSGWDKMELDQLSQWEQGLLWAALIHQDRADAALGRLALPQKDVFRRRLAAARTGDLQKRRTILAELSNRLFSPIPAGLNRIHSSWIEHLLEACPPAWRQLVRQRLPEASPAVVPPASAPEPPSARVQAYLLRQTLAPLAPMPPLPRMPLSSAPPAGPQQQVLALVEWSPERLHQALVHLGLLVMAAAARQVGTALQEALASRLEPTLRSKLLQTREQELPLLKVAVPGAELWGLPQPQMLCVLGARTFGPTLPQPLRQQVAQRLPRVLGLELLSEGRPAQVAPEQALELLLRADRWAQGGTL